MTTITRQDDRTPEEVTATIGFWVATDKCMSGWGNAPGKSVLACPVTSSEDSQAVEYRFMKRTEFKRIRFVSGNKYFPKLRSGDHLHIYDTKSFRY